MLSNTLQDNQATNNQIIISTTSSIQNYNPSYPQSDKKSNYYSLINKKNSNRKNNENDYSSLIKKYQNEETEYINFKSTDNYISSINSFQNNNQPDYNLEYKQDNNQPSKQYVLAYNNTTKKIKLENRINTIEREIKELNGKMDYFIQNYSVFTSYQKSIKNNPIYINRKKYCKSFNKKNYKSKIKNNEIKKKKMDMTLKMFDNKINNFILDFNKIDQRALSNAISPSMKCITSSIKNNQKIFIENKIIDKGYEINSLVNKIQKRLNSQAKNEYNKYYITKKDLLNKF